MTMKRLQRVRFRVEYTGMSDNIRNKTFQVKSITRQTAKQTRFRLRDKKSGREYEENVQDYFRKEYNHGLQHFNLPCVETMKGAVYPAELCHILPAQRYNFKLNENQTSNMIKFAVTRPQDRAKNIQEGLGLLNWQKDPMLAKYGMKINPSMIKTNARLLNPPTVEFGDGKVENPGTNGRWRIDGKRFIEKNSRTLRSWAVVVFNDWGGRDKVSSAEVEHFMGEFCKFLISSTYTRPPMSSLSTRTTAVENYGPVLRFTPHSRPLVFRSINRTTMRASRMLLFLLTNRIR